MPRDHTCHGNSRTAASAQALFREVFAHSPTPSHERCRGPLVIWETLYKAVGLAPFRRREESKGRAGRTWGALLKSVKFLVVPVDYGAPFPPLAADPDMGDHFGTPLRCFPFPWSEPGHS